MVSGANVVAACRIGNDVEEDKVSGVNVVAAMIFLLLDVTSVEVDRRETVGFGFERTFPTFT